MASNFDAQSFLQQTVEEPMATEPVLIPPGEYEAVIDKVGARAPKDNDAGVNLQITWEILDEALKAELDRPKIIVSQFMFVELDESGRIGTGGDKNWRLGQIRAAIGQAGNPWHPNMLQGAGPVRIRVVHNTYNNNTSAQVDRVVKL